MFLGLTYKGDVVASCGSDTDWIFSTVETQKSGRHPVCGNRAFGVEDNGDGSVTIWTKGADRAVNNGALTVPHQTEASRGDTFLAGEQVWKNFMSSVQTTYKDYNPRNLIQFSVRRSYPPP
jgi:hypothetical protein